MPNYSAERSKKRWSFNRRSTRTAGGDKCGSGSDRVPYSLPFNSLYLPGHQESVEGRAVELGLHRWARVARWVVVSRKKLAIAIGGSFDPKIKPGDEDKTRNAMIGNGVDRHPLC
jgi:hypothetical protein